MAGVMPALSDNMRGAGVCVAAYGAFALNDAILKLIMMTMPQVEAICLRGVLMTPLLALVAQARGELRGRIAASEARLLLSRCVCDLGSTFTFLAAIHAGPMADVAIILGTQPVLVMLGAALCLGDRIDNFSWVLGGLGIVGVVVVARPSVGGGLGLGAHVLYASAANAFGIGRDLLARRIGAALPAMQIATLSAASITLASGVAGAYLGGWAAPTRRDLGMLSLAACLLPVALVGSVLQMRIGDVGFVQPFRYTFIVWATLMGVLMFGHWPDAWTIGGALIVVGCGVASLWRERRAQRVGHGNRKGASRLQSVEEVEAAPEVSDNEVACAPRNS